MNTFLIVDLFFWSYVALLVVAAGFDVWRFMIPNWISAALVALFAGAVFLHPVRIDLLDHLAAMGLVLVGALVLYRFRVIGGGDLKLLAAVGLWTGLGALPGLLFWVAIAGATFSISLILLRRLLIGVMVAQRSFQDVTLPRILLPGECVPYGVAITFGGVLLARQLPHLGLFL